MPTANTTSAKSQQVDTKSSKQPIQNQQQAKQANRQPASKTALETASSETSESQTQNQEQAINTNTATAAGGVKTPPEQPEFIKQALVIIEKKVRNLEKRRQKLEEYKETQRKGTALNEDQLLAVSKFEEVIKSLELSRELEKQFIGLANDAMKQQKKQTKKEQMEREELIRDKIRDSQKYLSVLDTFGDDSIRNDFLNETNGAFKLTQNEMNMLDDFNKLVKPAELGEKLESSTTEIADHLTQLIDAKNKPIVTMNVTYSELKKLFDRLMSASYWTREPEQPTVHLTNLNEQEESVQYTTSNEQQQQQPQNTNELLQHENPLNPVQHVEQVHQQQQQQTLINEDHHQSSHMEQAVYHQQNTSDGYVLVTPNDVNDNLANNQSKSPNQQAQPKTFFTTLNPDLPPHRNINEFLNKCENNDDGINFLQDSEIQIRQQEQLQNELNYQQQQGGNNFNYNQDQNLSDGQKDNQYKQRGGHNGQRPYNSQRPRYTDDRRMGGGNQGGMPRNNGNGQGQMPMQPRNNNSGQSNTNQAAFNGGPRNQNSGYRGGSNSGPGNNNNGGGRGGYYRGGPPNNNQGGGFRNNNNGPRNYQQQPAQRINNNHPDNAHDNQQPQMA